MPTLRSPTLGPRPTLCPHVLRPAPGSDRGGIPRRAGSPVLGMSEPDVTSLMLSADSLDLLEFLAELDESFGPLGRLPES